VRDATGAVIAVLHVSAPSMRMRPPRPRNLLPQVVDAANRLSEALGAMGKPKAVTPLGVTPPANAWMSPNMMAQARPHTIFR
jgi:hypothetical protein